MAVADRPVGELVLDYLEKHPGRTDATTIAEAIGREYASVAATLSSMARKGKVKRPKRGVYSALRATASTNGSNGTRKTERRTSKSVTRAKAAPRQQFTLVTDHPKTGSLILRDPKGDLWMAQQIEL